MSDTRAIKPEDNKGGTFTQQLSAIETTTAYVSPVPTEAPGFITAEPGTVNEEAIYFKSKDAGAGTISGLTRDFTNLNGGNGIQHENGQDWEILQSARYITNILDILLEGFIQEQQTVDFVDTDEFTVMGNVAIVYSVGRLIRIDGDNGLIGTVVSSSYNGGTGLTTVVVSGVTVPDPIDTIEYGIQPKTALYVTPAGVATLSNKTFTDLTMDGAGIKFEQIATPANPAANHNMLYPKAGDKFATLNSAGVEQTLATEAYVTASSGGKSALYQNALLNGGFDVWQRGATFTPNDDVFTADRWNLLTETNGAWTIARDTDVPAASGFKYSAKLTNVTLNNQVALVQILENVDSMKFDDLVASLSFYAKTSGTEIANLRATILSWSSTADTVTSDVIATWASDGTDPTWATNWTAETVGVNKALTSSWQRFTIENVTIDTASMANIAIIIWLDDGTVAANDDFWITGVQLNQGATATPWVPRSYDEELFACQRYCYVPPTPSTGSFIGFGMCVSNAIARILVHFPNTMRGLPSLTATAGDYQIDDTTAATDVTSINNTGEATWNTTRMNNLQIQVSGTPFTAQRACSLKCDGTANRLMIFNAEL